MIRKISIENYKSIQLRNCIECWLMPLYYNDNRAGKITGCLSTINTALTKQNKATLSKPRGEKILQSYARKLCQRIQRLHEA